MCDDSLKDSEHFGRTINVPLCDPATDAHHVEPGVPPGAQQVAVLAHQRLLELLGGLGADDH